MALYIRKLLISNDATYAVQLLHGSIHRRGQPNWSPARFIPEPNDFDNVQTNTSAGKGAKGEVWSKQNAHFHPTMPLLARAPVYTGKEM